MKILALIFTSYFLANNPAYAGKRKAISQHHQVSKKKKLSHDDQECAIEKIVGLSIEKKRQKAPSMSVTFSRKNCTHSCRTKEPLDTFKQRLAGESALVQFAGYKEALTEFIADVNKSDEKALWYDFTLFGKDTSNKGYETYKAFFEKRVQPKAKNFAKITELLSDEEKSFQIEKFEETNAESLDRKTEGVTTELSIQDLYDAKENHELSLSEDEDEVEILGEVISAHKMIIPSNVIYVNFSTTLPTSLLTSDNYTNFLPPPQAQQEIVVSNANQEIANSRNVEDPKQLIRQAIAALAQVNETADFFKVITIDDDKFEYFVFLVHREIMNPVVPNKRHRAWFPDDKAFHYTVIDALALAYVRFLAPKNPHERLELIEARRAPMLGMIRVLPTSFRENPNTQCQVKAHELYKALHAIYGRHTQIFEQLESAQTARSTRPTPLPPIVNAPQTIVPWIFIDQTRD